MTITLRKDCLLKAARVYMVFDLLEKCGEVIKSIPLVDELEEEQFELRFTVTIITKEPRTDYRRENQKYFGNRRVNASFFIQVYPLLSLNLSNEE